MAPQNENPPPPHVWTHIRVFSLLLEATFFYYDSSFFQNQTLKLLSNLQTWKDGTKPKSCLYEEEVLFFIPDIGN